MNIPLRPWFLLLAALTTCLMSQHAHAQSSYSLNYFTFAVTVGSTVSIGYSIKAPVTTIVTLEVSTDSGRTWRALAELPEREYSSYSWLVPDDTTSSAFLRLAVDGSTVAMSPRFFIGHTSIVFSIRAPGASLSAVSDAEFVWYNPVFRGGTWIISYSADSINWQLLAGRAIALGENRFVWNVTPIPAERAFVRVAVDGVVRGVSEPFAVVESETPLISIISPRPRPNVQYRLFAGRRMPIRWNLHAPQSIAGPLSVEYRESDDAPWSLIAEATPRSGPDSILWDVPTAKTTRGQLRVRSSDSAVGDSTRAELWVEYGDVKILRPSSGDRLVPRSWTTIVWRDTGINAYGQFAYSLNNGRTWTAVRGGRPFLYDESGSTDSIAWEVPSLADSVRLRVVVTYPEGMIADTTGPFTITNDKPTSTGMPGAYAKDAIVGVRPVPASGRHVTVEWSQRLQERANVVVIDASGSVVLTGSMPEATAGRNQMRLDIGALASGTFRVIVERDGAVSSCSFVVVH
jgi:hypothetical protein